MINATLMTIHGFWSSPGTWDRLNAIWQKDEQYGLQIHPFGYLSPKKPRWPFSPTRLPDYDDIAQTLATEYTVTLAGADNIAIVTHSQGGLIVQRFLVWMLSEGRGLELARIRSITMLACPNGGSEYLRSIRQVLGYGHHPQAGNLEVLNRRVADTQRTVLQRIVNATGVDDHQCRIPLHVYAGDSDKVVTAASAQATFPRASTLAGNHFSILDPASPGNRTAETVKHHLVADLAAGSEEPVRQVPLVADTGRSVVSPPAADAELPVTGYSFDNAQLAPSSGSGRGQTVTDRWCHTSDGSKVPALMGLTHTGVFHPGYGARQTQDEAPSVKIGMLVACEPIDPSSSGSELRARFTAFLNSPAVRQLIQALTHVTPDMSWKNLAGHGPRTLEAALTADDDPMVGIPVASALFLPPTAGESLYGRNGDSATLILYIEPRTAAGQVPPASGLAAWSRRFNLALAIPAAFADFLAKDLDLGAFDDPPAQLGIWLKSHQPLTSMIDTQGLRTLPGSGPSNQFIGWAFADRDGKPIVDTTRDLLINLCEYNLHLDAFEQTLAELTDSRSLEAMKYHVATQGSQGIQIGDNNVQNNFFGVPASQLASGSDGGSGGKSSGRGGDIGYGGFPGGDGTRSTPPAVLRRRTLPLNDGLRTGTLLAIEVRAQAELIDSRVVLTSIAGSPETPAMATPVQLYWHPEHRGSTTIAEGALAFVNIAQVGPMPPGAMMQSPDYDLPWSLQVGEWRVELQFTAKGYSAQLIKARFNVRPAKGISIQSIEWSALDIGD